MAEGAGAVRAGAYYLDDRLSLDEGTCRFSHDGGGRETPKEGFYAMAIRRRGYRDCLFRFPSRDHSAARSMLEALNRSARAEASTLGPSSIAP
jgi:hypothetical protein